MNYRSPQNPQNVFRCSPIHEEQLTITRYPARMDPVEAERFVVEISSPVNSEHMTLYHEDIVKLIAALLPWAAEPVCCCTERIRCCPTYPEPEW